MKTLATDFTRNGWRHRQIERIGLVALFERSKPEISRPHYEVIKIRECHERNIQGGQILPAAEVYPSSEQWGNLGWTYNEIERAVEAFRKLVASQKAN